jgi:hypothetical protein
MIAALPAVLASSDRSSVDHVIRGRVAESDVIRLAGQKLQVSLALPGPADLGSEVGRAVEEAASSAERRPSTV